MCFPETNYVTINFLSDEFVSDIAIFVLKGDVKLELNKLSVE